MWMCERCSEINDDNQLSCTQCHSAKPGAMPPPPQMPMAGAPPMAPPPPQMQHRGPQLLTTSVAYTQGPTPYRIDGEIVPVLVVSLTNMPIYFEHYVLLWKSLSVNITIKPLSGMGKRILAGMPILVTQAIGVGDIAFSRDDAGHIFPIHLAPGQEIDVREHQFLAATDNVDYTYQRIKGISNILFGGTGFFIDKFICRDGDGIVWIHGYGNVFELVLAPGESIDVEPGGWVYKDPSVSMQTVGQQLATGFLASAQQIAFNRFTGPGRLGIQSMYVRLETAN